MSHEGRIVQISISAGGVPKRPVAAARVTADGIDGDGHRNTRYHGGPDRALCLYSIERIRALAAEGHPIVPGSIGENVTIEGLEWNNVAPGTRMRLGEHVVIEVTRYTTPCFNITSSFTDGDYSRVSQKQQPGSSRVYARVLTEGVIRRDDRVRLLKDEAALLDGNER
jgi:MOSC domain-containing protein YiiM